MLLKIISQRLDGFYLYGAFLTGTSLFNASGPYPSNARIIPNKKNPEGLNVGFVDMESKEAQQACIAYYQQNPLVIEELTITVCEARSKEEKNLNNRRQARPYNRNNDYNRTRESRPARRTYGEGHRSARFENDDNRGLYEYEGSRRNSYETRRSDRSFHRSNNRFID